MPRGWSVHERAVRTLVTLVGGVGSVAVMVSIPGFPGGDVVISYTKQVSFLALTTPLLAYAGLSVGKDMEAFKRLSWRIIPVASLMVKPKPVRIRLWKSLPQSLMPSPFPP